jgi:hypothetical protein
MKPNVLSSLHLPEEDYVIYRLSDPSKPFSPSEVLYNLIKNDEKLIAKLSPQAEATYAQLFLH